MRVCSYDSFTVRRNPRVYSQQKVEAKHRRWMQRSEDYLLCFVSSSSLSVSEFSGFSLLSVTNFVIKKSLLKSYAR